MQLVVLVVVIVVAVVVVIVVVVVVVVVIVVVVIVVVVIIICLWSRVLEKPIFPQPVKKVPTLYATQRFTTMFTITRHWSLS